MPTVSLREFGKMRGVSWQAVQKAISAGRLVKSVVHDSRGRPRIDPDIAEEEWADGTHPSHGGRREAGAISVDANSHEEAPARSGSGSAATFAQSRAIREAYMARLAKLDFEERSKQLVRVDEVKAEAFKVGRQVRESMMNIPDRIAAALAAEGDAFEVHKRLTEEIRKALLNALPGASP